MRKQTTETASESRPEWDTLEHWLRDRMQDLVQHVLDEEVTEFLGRAKSARRSDTDNDSGYMYRNGYARPRKLTLSSGTTEVSSPRVRNTEEARAQTMTSPPSTTPTQMPEPTATGIPSTPTATELLAHTNGYARAYNGGDTSPADTHAGFHSEFNRIMARPGDS